MLAVARLDASKGEDVKNSGTTYAWGRNFRGQLGIGNKVNQYAPVPIENLKERFEKVACGASFSLGLSGTHKVYLWGNFKYFGDKQKLKDIEEPTTIADLEQFEVVDISASYKQAIALTKAGKIRRWGRWLADTSGKKKGGEPGTVCYPVSIFPVGVNSDTPMRKISLN